MKKLSILLLFFCSIITYPQQFSYEFSFGKFTDAKSFYINPAGFIFVSDPGTSEIYKLDTLGLRLDDIGGYGWNEGNFDDPVDIFATSLNIFVSDKNNHRVQQFDKDLNYIAQFSTRESDNQDAQFGYPLSSVTSNQGDLYILDSENSRVVKFDMFGNFLMNFGGYDWGKYSLSAPVKLAVAPDNNIYIIDGKKIKIYDQYGTGIAIVDAEKNFVDINIIFNNLTINSDNNIYYSNLKIPGFNLIKLNLIGDEIGEIKSSLIFNNKLYVLTEDRIIVYTRTK